MDGKINMLRRGSRREGALLSCERPQCSTETFSASLKSEPRELYVEDLAVQAPASASFGTRYNAWPG